MTKKNCLLIGIFIFQFAISQEKVSEKTLNLRSRFTVTNNGFSFIPTFSLGKPAFIADFSVNTKRFSVEPELRYAAEGKPWAFVIMWRYKIYIDNKLQVSLGAHLPALAFKNVTNNVDNLQQTDIIVQRYLPIESNFNYIFSKNNSLNLLCLRAFGLDINTARTTDFISLTDTFSNIYLTDNIFLRVSPQIFYLRTGISDGFYCAAGITVSKKDFPISISTMINKAIQTNIAAKTFDWNVSLNYSIDKKYILKQ
jgi:hypothetical protein